MDQQQVIEGLNALCVRVRQRAPHVGAEVEAMTSEELAELYRLKALLPTIGQEREAAMLRIRVKRLPPLPFR